MSTDTESTALNLFPSMRPADHPLNKQQTSTEQKTNEHARDEDLAARLYGKAPEQKPAAEQKPESKIEPTEKQPADDDAARKLYGDSMYNDIALVTTEQHPQATAEQAAEANASVRAELHKLELSPLDARQLTQTFTAAMRAPLSDAEYDAKVASFKTELTRRFGSEVEERLADVRALLAKAHPAVTDALVESGMNYDIETIAALADHARSLKGRGRL